MVSSKQTEALPPERRRWRQRMTPVTLTQRGWGFRDRPPRPPPDKSPRWKHGGSDGRSARGSRREPTAALPASRTSRNSGTCRYRTPPCHDGPDAVTAPQPGHRHGHAMPRPPPYHDADARMQAAAKWLRRAWHAQAAARRQSVPPTERSQDSVAKSRAWRHDIRMAPS